MINSVINKIKAFSRKDLVKLENALEILLQTEGLAVRQTPAHKVDESILMTIREALKNNKQIKAQYNNKQKVLSPYGLIYGEKIYLFAREPQKGEEPYNYLLHKFSNVELTDEDFDKGDFNLKTFSEQSFGVYQGEIQDVKLLFSQDVADEVMSYNFHPTQKVKRNEDGTVTVKFKASGEYEILWHLFKWGESVKILAPKKLKQIYREYLESVLANTK